jgi:tryptophanyl-tRNA synthetase
LLDSPEVITKKVKRAKTDPVMGLEFGNPERPETDNLLGLYALLSGKGREAAAAECAAMGWGTFKPLLAETLVEALRPIQERYNDLSADPAELDRVLKAGSERANAVAQATLERTREALGFLKAN